LIRAVLQRDLKVEPPCTAIEQGRPDLFAFIRNQNRDRRDFLQRQVTKWMPRAAAEANDKHLPAIYRMPAGGGNADWPAAQRLISQ
jgi:hypothetical protein